MVKVALEVVLSLGRNESQVVLNLAAEKGIVAADVYFAKEGGRDESWVQNGNLGSECNQR